MPCTKATKAVEFKLCQTEALLKAKNSLRNKNSDEKRHYPCEGYQFCKKEWVEGDVGGSIQPCFAEKGFEGGEILPCFTW